MSGDFFRYVVTSLQDSSRRLHFENVNDQQSEDPKRTQGGAGIKLEKKVAPRHAKADDSRAGTGKDLRAGFKRKFFSQSR